MVRPLVSILIPAYNAEKWISESLRSALAQTWEPKEIIVVDDGSKDRTVEIVRRFACDKVTIASQKNAGAAAARNKALSLSRGEYIQYLDADDLIAPDKIAKQMEALGRCASKRTLLSSSWGKFVYRYHRSAFVPTALWCDLSPAEWLIRKMQYNLYMQTSTWLVSRELAEAAGPWNTQLLGDDDGEYFCRVLLASDGVCFVPEAKVYYRLTGVGSLSYIGLSNDKMDAQMCSLELHIRYLRSLDDSPRARQACVAYLQSWLHFFHPNRPDLVKRAWDMAAGLGHELPSPRLSWRLSLFARIFGWRRAKRAHYLVVRFRWFAARCWDKFLLQLESKKMRESL